MESGSIIALVLIVPVSAIVALVSAAETALERASDARIQAAAVRGDPRARLIAGETGHAHRLLGPLTSARVLSSAVTVTLAAYIGAVELDGARGPLALGLAAGLWVALLQMTVGLLAARNPEYAALYLSNVVRTTGRVFGLPALLLGLPARLLARSLRTVAPKIDTDILAVIEREEAAGGVEEQESRMIRGIINLEDKTAREIMVPRIDIAAADIDDSVEDVATIVNERGFSRIPVYRENIDDIVGIVFAKDLLRAITNGGRERQLKDLIRDAYFIPESKRLDELLAEMKSRRTHLAIVVDEYGGTAGVVTIEDLLEEIVGEIEDEYDIARPTMEVISPDEVVLDAGVTTDVLKELFDYEVESEDFDTVGGFVIHQLGRLPSVGDEVRANGLTLRVLSMSGRRVRRLRIARAAQDEDIAETAGAR
ncbi:MAG: HlyC/CorC family transporter [Dehalococcoidia bacterium]|nr:HlyC/CorC family transporter [Dehalococcoidia bacterium]